MVQRAVNPIRVHDIDDINDEIDVESEEGEVLPPPGPYKPRLPDKEPLVAATSIAFDIQCWHTIRDFAEPTDKVWKQLGDLFLIALKNGFPALKDAPIKEFHKYYDGSFWSSCHKFTRLCLHLR